jgi:hypothetical protein
VVDYGSVEYTCIVSYRECTNFPQSLMVAILYGPINQAKDAMQKARTLKQRQPPFGSSSGGLFSMARREGSKRNIQQAGFPDGHPL